MRGRPNAPIDVDDLGEHWDLELRTIGVDAYAEERAAQIRRFRRLLEHLRRQATRSEDDERLYLHAADLVSVDELTHLDLATIGRALTADLSACDSFWRSIATRRRRKQLGPVPERYLGINKDFDQLFGTILGVRLPVVRYTGPLADAPRECRDAFLKPQKSSGSKGAFYLYDRDRIQSVQHGTTLSSWDEMLDSIRKQFDAEFVDEGVWQIQDLVTEAGGQPARDLKFYAFYGVIGLIQEVSRHRGAQYQFFDEDGTVAACGREHERRFTDPAATITDKGGVDATRLDEVRNLSRQVPAPFMRIDYLNGADGLVLAEFSSAPGMSHTLSHEYDRRLGRMYLEAENRLTADLLDGKTFVPFADFLQQRAERLRSAAG